MTNKSDATALRPTLTIEFRQHDFMPGFAAYADDGSVARGGPAFCILNVGDLLATVATGDSPAADLPYVIAECMMHEIIHAIEAWAGVEFSEERVEALIDEYRATHFPETRAAASGSCNGGEAA